MYLRRLTSSGVAVFQDYLIQLADNPKIPVPFELLENNSYSEEINPAISVEAKQLSTRYEAAEYLNSVLGTLEETHDVLADIGMWAWLSLLFFEQICPCDSKGNRQIKALVRYIPNVRDYRKYYRHLLAGPYRAFRAHRDAPDRVVGILTNPLHKPGEVYEQIASLQGVITAPGAVAATTKLYYDSQRQSLKRGAATKGAGGARNLHDFFNQIDLTWDLYSTPPDKIIALLPKQFNKFKAIG